MPDSTPANRRYAAILALPVTLTVLGPAAAWAQTQSLAGKPATMICRPAQPGESAAAKMIDGGTPLVCRPFAVSMHMNDGSLKTIGSVTAKPMSGPDFSHALTPQQLNDVYNRWVEKALNIDPATRNSP
jgi:hypothetical protein